MKPPQPTYLVQVYRSPHWTDVLSTKDKAKAEAELKKLGKAGRITEIRPKKR
jgi:hypothetical protein